MDTKCLCGRSSNLGDVARGCHKRTIGQFIQNEANHYFFFFGFFFLTPAAAALLCAVAAEAAVAAVAAANSSAATRATDPPVASGRGGTGSGSDWFCIFRISERFSASNRLRMIDDRDLYFKHYRNE